MVAGVEFSIREDLIQSRHLLGWLERALEVMAATAGMDAEVWRVDRYRSWGGEVSIPANTPTERTDVILEDRAIFEPPSALASPARWLPDPLGRHELRYWDGQRWTEHVSDSGVVAADPV